MAAHEEEGEGVVPLRPLVEIDGEHELIFRWDEADNERLAATSCALAADLIGDTTRGDVNEPTARLLRYALAWPLRGGRDHRLLHCVFACREVAVAAKDDRERLRREISQQALYVVHDPQISSGGPLITWRTSIGR